MISSTGAAMHGADGTLAVVRSPDPFSGEMKGGSMGNNVLVQQAEEVRCWLDEDGDVVFVRAPYEWESSEQVSMFFPRACVPSLIKHLQALISEGAD